MQDYELTLIFQSGLSEEQVDSFIDSMGIEINGRQKIGRRLFTYPINKNREGNYVFCDVRAEKKQMDSVMKKLNIDDKIIRYLVISKKTVN